jgi:uncharacterized membrane protein YgdD (TMEM256/DUF423 family)
MKKIGVVAAVLGFAGVALGAFGAHALKARLAETGMTSAWETAVLYHLVHAVAVLALCSAGTGAAFRGAAYCWTAGIVAFSGSLYVLALGGPGWLGPVTPLGGGALLIGWALAGWTWWCHQTQ